MEVNREKENNNNIQIDLQLKKTQAQYLCMSV